MRETKRRDRLTVEVEPDLREELERWASNEGRPVGNLVRHVLTLAVQNERRIVRHAGAAG